MEYKTHYLSFLINNFHNALHRSAAHTMWKNTGDTCRIGIITNIATNHEMIIFDQKFCTFKCTFFTHKKLLLIIIISHPTTRKFKTLTNPYQLLFAQVYVEKFYHFGMQPFTGVYPLIRGFRK